MGNLRTRWLVLLLFVLTWPASSAAQEATLTGVVKDTSGGVLPGVTVTATHRDTGNVFVAVTDEVGAFRMPVRTGGFAVTFELPAFATVSRSADLLVGQAVTLTVEMKPDVVVLVTGDADFAHLALQLRRRGIRVEAASLAQTLGAGLKSSVNEAIDLAPLLATFEPLD